MQYLTKGCVILLATLLSGPAEAADEGRDAAADALVSGLMESIGIKSQFCGPNAYRAPKLPIAACGKVPRKARNETESLLAAIDAYFERAGAPPFDDGGAGWRREGAAAHRVYSDDRVPITVSLDTEGGEVIVRYVARLEPCMTSGLPRSDDPRVSGPETLSKPRPEFPVEARRQRASGRVQLMAVVRADGTVGEMCVQYARPEGLGFEQAVIDAVRQWRFEPARIEGRPADVLFTVFTSFDLQ